MHKVIHATKHIFLDKVKTKEMKIGVIGLGYVGLPLAMEFAQEGYSVVGIDIDEQKVATLNQGQSHIIDISNAVVNDSIDSGNFTATTDFSAIKTLDAVSICVPTPLNKNQEPDISYIETTIDQLLDNYGQPLLMVLESTTYPGTTRELLADRFAAAGYQVDQDYFVCFSPERVDPGNEMYQTKQIPKVIGGISEASTEIAQKLYEDVLDEIVPVSSPETAEMSKLLENTFRSINIAFVNEMALMCDRMGVNIWESIDAASTKPFGYMPFYPGPGVGGHCIPLDPMYLHWKGKQDKFFSQFIELSQMINMNMPYKVVEKVQEALDSIGKSIKSSKILLLGMAYKSNIDDVRESPALDVYEILNEKDCQLDVLDPFVTSFKDKVGNQIAVRMNTMIDYSEYDCVVVLTKHDIFDYDKILEESQTIVDMRYSWKAHAGELQDKIFTIGG
ncbi:MULTISPECIES: nucleotide sugar dehydrogenase [unclassified Enterococcus]|uniref:nucleotide sugar dehydrogenase n=1 Tax=unclassified Enterococcus TaxID=2608891 RepID=UPI001CE21E41|nr:MULTISPECIES: nucleotide sugar dehydrogenase [unclassified Enterococcus]MCA5014450.1 nucleotide sugar dehydrogenase [Enterococcus sp. S23]MCA5017436.1 nucleotide sugar dehydrogenase [Enterococcus sp. S22(2020)]